MAQREITESIELLEKQWEIDSTFKDFLLGKISDISDYTVSVNNVVFHIPFLINQRKFVLWKCYWPDCHNCCDRQGRLPLTSDDLIKIGQGMKYKKTSDFVKNETIIATWKETSPSGGETILTNVNLKRKQDETISDDGTHISCRFLDEKGYCSTHPNRPGVCYLYPFSTWLQNDKGVARVHATYQFTGDCPGFYLADTTDSIKKILEEYSGIIYDYNMKSNKTSREGFSSFSFV